MVFFYNLSVLVYKLLIYFASPFNKKAKLWVSGRKGLFENIKKRIRVDTRIAWFHCASLGEFEQGRPVIEAFRKKYPSFKILITFFSPSGYEVRKTYNHADYIFYLPIDTPSNAKRFVNIVNPEVVFFVKYEFWFNYIKNICQKEIPFFIISANFRPGQHFFKWYGGWFRRQLKGISWTFVQNKKSAELLQGIGITKVTVSGDTRFDRVHSITQDVKRFPVIEKFCKNSDVLIAGSSWPPDEDLLTKLINSEKTKYKFIIAPHLVDKPHIAAIAEKINKGHVVLYSEADEENVMYTKVMIIDSIGILSHVYQYGKIAYIGGGFGSDIHNILEAATFGMPVIFGPKYHKFQEAVNLIKEGGAFSINNEQDFFTVVLKLMNNQLMLKDKSEIAKTFVQKNIGATEIILKETAAFLHS